MEYVNRRIDWNALGKTSSITPQIQQHLMNVYSTLTLGVLLAALGAITFLKTHVGGSLTFISGILLIFWLAMTPKHEVSKRLAIFSGFCFMQGMSIGPLIDAVLEINPAIITSAFMGTTLIFFCFSASAYLAERRSFLYLGGFLSTALTLLCFASFASLFFPSLFLFNIQLYVGLLVFCGFIIFDTQLIIEKAARGSKDFVSDSLELFLDFVNVFVRLLIILSKMNGGSKKKNNR